MTVKAPPIENIKAGFVKDPLDKILDNPKHHDIDKLQKQCIQNATKLKTIFSGGNNGSARLAKFPQIHGSIKATAYYTTDNNDGITNFNLDAISPSFDHLFLGMMLMWDGSKVKPGPCMLGLSPGLVPLGV
eukprot:8448980-Ditylum_brightwellii.AAC.1